VESTLFDGVFVRIAVDARCNVSRWNFGRFDIGVSFPGRNVDWSRGSLAD
jgi:hypothetical protein